MLFQFAIFQVLDITPNYICQDFIVIAGLVSVMGSPLVSLVSSELGLLGLRLDKGAPQRPPRQSSEHKESNSEPKLLQDKLFAELPM